MNRSQFPSGASAGANMFDRKLDLAALFKFTQIPASTQVHLKKVYSSLALCMLAAAAGSYVHVVARLFQGGLLSLLASLVTMLWLATTPHNGKTERKRLAVLSAFAFFVGVGLGPALDYVVAIDPAIVVTSFLGSAAMFACFTLSALYAERRSYLYLGGTLLSGICLLALMSLSNAFLGSMVLFRAQTVLGLLVGCGLVLFDTQLIIEKAECGDRDYVWHCVELFLDFVTIFRRLMVLLANEEEKKRRSNSNKE